MAATVDWPGGHIEILIAEDDPEIRALVLEVVSGLGHATSCATNGVEALDLYNARGADVVVSDWMMPHMDGVQLCRCVRARLSAPYTYFILLTALADAEHLFAGMQAGADDYLAKPFNLSDIEARLIVAERVTTVHRQREALLQSALVALEHARLDGVRLAARTAQHELNNRMAVARGYAEMLAGSPDMPPHLMDMVKEVKQAADDAARIVRQLRGVSHIHEHHWPGQGETTIDLARSQAG